MTHTFRPSVTVAAIIERDGRFLLIEEETSDGIRLNQPAGHLDPLESLEQAVVREALEETAHEFIPKPWSACTCRATTRSRATPT